MYFRMNLKMKKQTLCYCFTCIVFIELNFTVAFLLMTKTGDGWFADKVGGGWKILRNGGILVMRGQFWNGGDTPFPTMARAWVPKLVLRSPKWPKSVTVLLISCLFILYYFLLISSFLGKYHCCNIDQVCTYDPIEHIFKYIRVQNNSQTSDTSNKFSTIFDRRTISVA